LSSDERQIPPDRSSLAGHAVLCVDAVQLSPRSGKSCPTRGCLPAVVLGSGRWLAGVPLSGLLARNRGHIDDKATCGVRKQVIRETAEHDYGCE
jgi:hypothetical protein